MLHTLSELVPLLIFVLQHHLEGEKRKKITSQKINFETKLENV